MEHSCKQDCWFSATTFSLPKSLGRDRNGVHRKDIGPWPFAIVLVLLLALSGSLNLYFVYYPVDFLLSSSTVESDPRDIIVDSVIVADSFQGTAIARRASSTSSSSSSHEGPHKQVALLFLFNALVIGTAVTHLTTLPLFHGLQQTVVIFALGVVYSLVQEGLQVKDKIGEFGESYDMWMDIDPHLLLFTLLPPLLAGDAMAIDMAVAKRVAKQCLYLASFGVLFNGMATAMFLMAYLNWSFLLSLMTGAILCATDPVAVVALLKELGASPTLTVQIQGESLLNDGTAIVLYMISYNMISGQKYDASDIVMFLIKTAMMAWGLGILIGFFFFRWIKAASNRLNHSSTNIQISLTLCCAYWSFIMAEGVFHISGVLATVAASLMLGSYMWPHIVSEEAMHHVWHTFESLGNVIIFFLAGALTGNAMVHIDYVDYFHLIVIYLVLTLIRAVLLFSSRPILKLLNSSRQQVSMKDCAVMTWGGLRGAVGLALAVQVRVERAEDDDGNYNIGKKDAERILFYVAGVAFLTLLINATTCPLLVKKLGIAATPSAKQYLQTMLHQQLVRVANASGHPKEVTQSLKQVLEDVKKRIYKQQIPDMPPGERNSQGLTSVAPVHEVQAQDHSDNLIKEYQEVKRYCSKISQDEIDLLGALPEMMFRDKEHVLISLLESAPIDWNRTDAVKSAFLNLVLSQYWHFLEVRDLSPGSLEAGVLMASISLARSETTSELKDFHFILPHIIYSEEELSEQMAMAQNAESFKKIFMSERRTFSKAVYRVSRASSVEKTASAKTSEGGGKLSMAHRQSMDSRRHTSKFEDIGMIRTKSCIESPAFSIAMAAMIVLNGLYIAVEETARNAENDDSKAWLVIEVFFTVIFTVECLLKLVDQGLQYFFDAWNMFDLCLVILGIFGLVVDAVVSASDVSSANVSNEARIVRIARVFRVFRLLRLFRLIRFFEEVKSKLTQDDVSFIAAEHMQKMTMLTCYIRAHLLAQKEFMHFFCGFEKDVTSVEVARCMLQSQAFVYMATCLAAKEVQELDKVMLLEVNMIHESKEVTEELEHFVMSAYDHGVLGGREAEALLVPLHHHIKDCMKQLERSHNGHSLHSSATRIIPKAPPGPDTRFLEHEELSALVDTDGVQEDAEKFPDPSQLEDTDGVQAFAKNGSTALAPETAGDEGSEAERQAEVVRVESVAGCEVTSFAKEPTTPDGLNSTSRSLQTMRSKEEVCSPLVEEQGTTSIPGTLG